MRKLRTDPPLRPKRSIRGLTMVEATVALAIAGIATMGLVSSLLASSKLQQKTQEFGLAHRTIRQVHEQIRNGDLDERFNEFLAAPVFFNGPLRVEVSFPEEVLTDVLGTAVPTTWRFRDTDMDGDVDLDLVAGDAASLLPVRVTVTWDQAVMSSSFLVTEK